MTAPITAGRTCLLSSVSNAWRHVGHRVSEPVLFLLGGGNRVECRLERRDGAPLIFVGHHSAEIVAGFCRELSVSHRLWEGASDGAKAALELERQLDAGNPPVIWVEMSLLPYMTARVPAGAMHAVTVESLQRGEVTVADCYVSNGLFSPLVRTHRERIALERFVAWERTNYLRHEIDYRALGAEPFCVSAAQISLGLEVAAYDFVGGLEGAWGSGARLLRFAEELPRIPSDHDARTSAQLFASLAYSIRYFGILWSREFLSEVMQAHAQTTQVSELGTLAENLQATRRSWQSMMFMAAKLSSERNPERGADLLGARMRAAVEEEARVYTRLLELRLSGAGRPHRIRARTTELDDDHRFGYGAKRGDGHETWASIASRV
jgi:hypothetical protein